MRALHSWRATAVMSLVTAVVVGSERGGWERAAAVAVIVAAALAVAVALAVVGLVAFGTRDEWAEIAEFENRRRVLR
jgi:hypothetical protein